MTACSYNQRWLDYIKVRLRRKANKARTLMDNRMHDESGMKNKRNYRKEEMVAFHPLQLEY